MITLTSEQFTLNTAEDERNYFTGDPRVLQRLRYSTPIRPGTYTVRAGRLCPVTEGLPLAPFDEPQPV